MTHKQNTRNINKANHANYYKRPLLFSSEDEERLAIQSSRARLMMELVTKPEDPSDFNHKDVDLNYKTPPHLIQTTYPSLVQSLRWNPHVETCSEDSQNDFPDCRYHTYKSNHKYDRYTENMNKFPLKRNIMRFCDNSTMTRVVSDMCCGVQTPTTSEASISTANIAVTDQSRTQMSQTFYMPVPILKRQDYEPNYEKKRKVKVLDPPINTCSDYEKLLRSVNNMEPFCCTTNTNNVNCRRVLYNEGISNMIAENDITQHPLPSQRLAAQSKFSREVKTRHKFVGDKPNMIPFDHNAHSKYHNHCSHPIPDLYKVDDNINDLASSNIMNKHPHRPVQYIPYSPGIKLPRRVLTSERDVDLYVDKRRPKLLTNLKNKLTKRHKT